jgi:WD40 repeat protein
MPDFEPHKAQPAWQLVFEGSWPSAVAFVAPDRLVAGNERGELYLWDLSAGPPKPEKDKLPNLRPVRKLAGHANGVTRLRTTSTGLLVSASLDKTIRVWDTTRPAEGKTEVVLDEYARLAEARRTKKDDALRQPGFEIDVQKTSEVLEGHKDWVQGLDLSADDRRLVSGDDSGTSVVWDFAARKELRRWGPGWRDVGVVSSALSPDGRTVFVAEHRDSRGSFDRPPAQARLFDAETGQEKLDVMKVQFPDVKVRDNSYGYGTTWGKFTKGGLRSSRFSPDGTVLGLGQSGETDTGAVVLLDPATGKTLRTTAGHKGGCQDFLFAADGKTVLSVGRDTLLRVSHVADGKETGSLGKERGAQFKDILTALAVSPDQRLIAATDIAGIVHVWRAG